jgi:hypothetical protein
LKDSARGPWLRGREKEDRNFQPGREGARYLPGGVRPEILLDTGPIAEKTDMKPPKLNKEWHEKHKMPAGATLEQRIQWHLAHRKHCGCRPIPAQLAKVMKAKGLL